MQAALERARRIGRTGRMVAAALLVVAVAGASAVTATPQPPRTTWTPPPANRVELPVVPPARAPLRDVTYATPAGVELTYDVTFPADLEPAPPVVVVLHGGGWWKGDKSELRTMRGPSAALAHAGFVVVAANYRLACSTTTDLRRLHGLVFDTRSELCGWRVQDQAEDVRALVRHVRDNGELLHADTERIGVVGISAGGHLALLAATADDEVAESIDAVVNFSGPPSTAFIARHRARTAPPIYTLRGPFENAVGCAPSDCSAQWRAASPDTYLDARTPRFALLSMGGATETQVPFAQLRAFHARLAGLEWDATLLAGAEACHGLSCSTLRVGATDQTGMQHALAFLRDRLEAAD